MGKEAEVRIGFIGAGAMGGAIARALVESGALPRESLAVADPSGPIRNEFHKLGIISFESASELVVACAPAVVVLAIKPQVLPAVVAELAEQLSSRLVVSIAAGVKISALETLLPGARIVRCMPNLPMQVRSGAVAIARGSAATDDDMQLVCDLLGHLGVARAMREDQLDAAGVISGCAPAFFSLFVDCLTRAGIEAGMTASDCRAMIASTMRGTAEQLLESDEHPRAYMERVTSPGGTTIAALRVMEPQLFAAACEGTDAALARTAQLAQAAQGGVTQ